MGISQKIMSRSFQKLHQSS